MSILELQAQRAGIIEEAQKIVKHADETSKGTLDTDARSAFEKLMTEANEVGEQIDIRERLEKEQAGLALPEQRKVITPKAGEIVSIREVGKLRSFKTHRDAYVAGRWISAIMFGDDDSKRWLADNAPEVRVMTGGVNAAGGYLIPDGFEAAVIDNRDLFGSFRQHARIIPMSGDSTTQPVRTGGLTAYYVNETAEITASDLSWKNITLNARKLAALSRLSSDLDEDSFISMADNLATEIGQAFAEAEDDAGWNGDGSNTYGGITGVRPLIAVSGLVGSIDQTGDVMTAVTLGDLAKVMGALPTYALPNAKWHCSQSFKGNVFDRLTTAAGGNTIKDLEAGFTPRFMGYPIALSEKLPAGVATDYTDLAMAVFGDLSKAAVMGDRRGIRIKASDQRYIEFDQLAIQGTERYDIVVHDVGTSSKAGPIVAMVGA